MGKAADVYVVDLICGLVQKAMKNKTKYKGKFKSSTLYINDVCMVSDRKQKHDKNTNSILQKDGFKASLMTCTSDTVGTHLQRCRTLGSCTLL